MDASTRPEAPYALDTSCVVWSVDASLNVDSNI